MPRDPIALVAKPLVFAACLAPALRLAWGAVAEPGMLGANPIEYVIRDSGDWALRMLLVSLSVTPLREAFDAPALMRFRRMLGLFAFFYAAAHVAAYVGLDQFFDVAAIWADIVKRTYITVGVFGLACLIPLAVTSTRGWVRRLGAPAWTRLHRLVHPAAIAACLHHYMMVRADTREPLLYAAILSALLAWRLAARWRRARRRRARKREGRPMAAPPLD